MSDFNKFNNFMKSLGLQEHNLSTDVLKVYLSNIPPVATNTKKSDIVGISEVNGYSPVTITSSWAETGGVSSLTGDNITITASGGSIGPFRYVIMYNDTHSNDCLIGWWDYGSSYIIADGEDFGINFSDPVLQLS